MNLNSGTPWSELALADLRNSMQLGESVAEIADYLCRDIQEIRDKIAERTHNIEVSTTKTNMEGTPNVTPRRTGPQLRLSRLR
jgi:hypothetical protein